MIMIPSNNSPDHSLFSFYTDTGVLLKGYSSEYIIQQYNNLEKYNLKNIFFKLILSYVTKMFYCIYLLILIEKQN